MAGHTIVSGSAHAKIEDEIVNLSAWDAVRVSPETGRAFEVGPEGAEILAFGAPNTESMDAELIPNWWTD